MNNSQSSDGKFQRSAPQWTALVVSVLIVLTVLGLVLYDIFVIGISPPVIEVLPRLDEVRQEQGKYYLPVTLLNSGARTAEDVTVSFTLQPLQGDPESAGFTIRFLAPGEHDTGVLIFGSDPRAGRLFHSTSFVRPY